MADNVVKLVDSASGELVSYSPTEVYADDSAMSDAKIDGIIYRKVGAKTPSAPTRQHNFKNNTWQ